MVSIEFLYFFLPAFMGLYVAVSPKQRSKIVMFGTALVVGWINIWGLIPLAVSVFSTYLGAIMIDNFREKKIKKRIFLVVTLVINLGVFFIFAYSQYDKIDFLGAVTMGRKSLNMFVSFGTISYVMHSVSYCVDVYKGKYHSEHSFSLVSEYIAFLPVLTAGPVLRFDEMSDTLHNPVVTSEKMSDGIKLLLVGMAEKLLLSNSMYELWSNIKGIDTMTLSAGTAWIGIIAFSFSFCFEFASFSNIGRGLALMLGFEIKQNFNSPFLSKSFREFFTRFNISLNSFIEEYIYNNINRKKDKNSFCFVCALLAGLIGSMWYGFGMRMVLYSIFVALILLVESLLKKPLSVLPNSIRCVMFNILLLTSLPVLAMPSPNKALEYFLAMFGANRGMGDVLSVYFERTSILVFIICIILSTNLFSFLKKKITSVNDNIFIVIQPVYQIVLLLFITAFLISGNSQLFELLY